MTPPFGIMLRNIRIKVGATLYPHAKIGHIGGPLPDHIRTNMHMYIRVGTEIAFGGNLGFRKRPVSDALTSIVQEVRKIIESFMGEFP